MKHRKCCDDLLRFSKKDTGWDLGSVLACSKFVHGKEATGTPTSQTGDVQSGLCQATASSRVMSSQSGTADLRVRRTTILLVKRSA